MTALAPRQGSTSSTVEGMVEAAIDGDERAWEAICDRHLHEVRAVAHARLRDAHAAEDVVQETMLLAWTRLHQVEDPNRLGAWLKTIAANVAVDHVRRDRRTAPLDDAARTLPCPEPAHDDVVVANEEAAVLHEHLRSLRAVDRRALWQRDAHGVPVGELADELGMTAGSVRVLLTRARRRVRDGYGLVLTPLLGLQERLRARFAGLQEALPVAVAAPAVVVAVVAGVVVPTLDAPAPEADPATSIAVAPTVARSTGTPAGAAAPATAPASATSSAPTAAPSAAPAAVAPSAAAEPTRTGPRVSTGQESVGFTDAPPTEDRPDQAAPAPTGPVEGVEVYLEETDVDGLGQGCVLCDD